MKKIERQRIADSENQTKKMPPQALDHGAAAGESGNVNVVGSAMITKLNVVV